MSTTTNDICKTLKLITFDQIMWHLKNCGGYSNTDLKAMEQIVRDMKKEGQNQLKLPHVVLVSLLIVYGIMIVFGTIGSFMVIFIVARNKLMRTPRNLFILNLAISDLILCVFTEPFNLLRLLSGHQEWNLGDVACKMTSMLPGTNILVSTLSIMAIALDRFHIIVHPEKPPISTRGVIKILIFIWFLSIVISLPFFFFSKVYPESPKKCFEAVGYDKLKLFRVAHAHFMLILQYVVPVVIVSVTYFRICVRIKYRMVNQRNKAADRNAMVPISQATQQKRQVESRRQRKTNILLASIAVIFALSWLPLNTVNTVMDFRQNSFDQRNGINNSTLVLTNSNDSNSSNSSNANNNASYILSIQAICLLIVLCSACANPVLYGWLNENFKKEFKLIFSSVCSMCPSIRKPTRGNDEVAQLVTSTQKSTIENDRLQDNPSEKNIRTQ